MPHRYPNILWLMTDEQRCDSLGCYGSDRAHTPHIDALARDGVLFSHAVTPAPVCVPARTSILTARYPNQTGVWHNSLDLQKPLPNLMSLFHDAGYRTASFGKQHYAGAGSAFEQEAGGCLSPHVHYFGYDARYEETAYDVVKYPGTIYNWVFGGRYPAEPLERTEWEAVAFAKQWLEQNDGDDPFFLRVSFNGPHTPVVPPAPFDRIIDPKAIRFPEEAEHLPGDSPAWLAQELTKCADASVLSEEQIRKMRRYYYGETAFLDNLFGQLLNWMESRGFLDDTIVVYVSDHGTHLGDYGLVQKQTFFEPVVNVPFIFRYPRKLSAGARIQTPVEIHALLPTLAEIAGIATPPDGCARSLADALVTGREPEARPVFSAFTLASFRPHIQHDGRLVMVRDGDWKLSVCLDPEPHDITLHNLAEDPLERVNLAEDDACRNRRGELLGLVWGHIGEDRMEQP